MQPRHPRIERRKHGRIPFVVPVLTYGGAGGDQWQAWDLNVAGDGMYVTALALLPPGTHVEVGFQVPGHGIEILTEAVVVWTNYSPNMAGRRPPGMGLHFRDLEPEYQRIIQEYIAHWRAEQLPRPFQRPRIEGFPPIAQPSETPPADGANSRPQRDGGAVDPTRRRADRPTTPVRDPRPPPTMAAPVAKPHPTTRPEPAAIPLSSGQAPDEPLELLPEAAAEVAPIGLLPRQLSRPGSNSSIIKELLDQSAGTATPADAATLAEEAPSMPAGRDHRQRLHAGALLGAYQIKKWLGSGQLGDVYLAEHKQTGRRVAIKRLRSEHARNRPELHRYMDEARNANQLGHGGIIETADFVIEPDHVYCIMAYLDGTTLAQRLARQGVVPVERALQIAGQICEALAAAHHAGIIHRNLKPQNIMLLQRTGRPDLVKVLDFGVAKLIDAKPKNYDSGRAFSGIADYLSPEQLLGHPADHRADIYALGVILYQMLTGTNPFASESWGQAVVKHATVVPTRPIQLLGGGARLPRQLDQLIMRCLEKTPTRRPSDVTELVSTINRLRDAPPAHPAARLSDGWWKPKQTIGWALAGVVSVGVGLLASWHFGWVGRAPPPPIPQPAETAGSTVAPSSPRRTRPTETNGMSPDFVKGREYLLTNEPHLAVEALEQCVAAHPRHAAAYRLLGAAYEMLGQEAAAIEAYEHFVWLAPDDPATPELRRVVDRYRIP